MSLIFTDGFEHYSSNADLLKKWTSDGSWGNGTTTSQARTGSRAAVFRDTTKSFNSAQEHATFIVGFGVYKAIGDGVNLFLRSDSGSTTHITITLGTDGSITVRRGNTGGTVLGTSSPSLIATNAWTYVEVKAILHDSTGSVVVKINNSTVLNLTGQDTKNGGTKTVFDGIYFNSQLNNTYFDDIYVCNGAGSTNNDFLGDVRIATIYPNGNGTTKQLTGTGDATNTWNNVDDAQPNITDYNETTAADQYDTYALENLPAGAATVYGVNVFLYALKTDSGLQSIAPMLRSGSTDYEGTAQPLSTSYNYYNQIYETDPNTSSQWTVSNVNSLEAGLKGKAS